MGTSFWIFLLVALPGLGYVLIRFFKNLSHVDQPISENVIELTDGKFEQTIKQGITLVDFWAPWCMPCRVQNPIINELADELKGKVKICKLNVDEQKQTAVRFKIRSIPSIIIFNEGKPVKQLVGVKSKHSIVNKIDPLLK